MTLAQAQAAAGQLRTALLDYGVRAVSLELQEGVAGSGWYVPTFKRGMGHHIVSRPPGTPGLGLVKRGRGAPNPLTGPLCNGYGGFDLVARIITMGWANHPGLGGPWSVPGWGTIPRDNGRPYIFGWEFEGGLDPYTDEMHDFMARCGAGTLDWLGTLPGNPGPAPLECWGEHKDPWAPGRKVDRLGYTAASGRQRIAAVRTTIAPDPSQQQQEATLMRYVNLDNPTGATPDRVAALTVDAVGISRVMPAGAEAWVQWHAFFPGQGATVSDAKAQMQWLVFVDAQGKTTPMKPVELKHGSRGAIQLPKGTEAVQVRIQGIPQGGTVGVHIDGLGHA